jgi:hypothetical protein
MTQGYGNIFKIHKTINLDMKIREKIELYKHRRLMLSFGSISRLDLDP